MVKALMPPLFQGTFAVIPGRGHARQLGFRTLNLDLRERQPAIDHGIYAGWVTIDGARHRAAIHYGPRLVLNDPKPSLEAHLIEVVLDHAPDRVHLELSSYLREIRDFDSQDQLIAQITDDVEQVRSLFGESG